MKTPASLLRRSVMCQSHRAERSKKIWRDFIWLPASVGNHTALDFKYPSYRRGRAGDWRLASRCVQTARLSGPQWTHRLGTTAPILSSLSAGIDRNLSDWLWQPYLTTPTKPSDPTPTLNCSGRMPVAQPPDFLLRNMISSNQHGINQRLLIP